MSWEHAENMFKGLISPCLCLAFLVGCATVDYQARSSIVHLPADRASYFYSNHLTGSGYIELKSDGTYRQIAREHMGVWPFDGGTWHQDADGVLTFMSTSMCADVISPPLEISVGRPEWAQRLPELREAILGMVRTNSTDRFPVGDFTPLVELEGDYNLAVMADYSRFNKFVTRTELMALVSRLDAYLKDPTSQRYLSAIPRTYKGRTFLLWTNCGTPNSRNLNEICSDIDKAKRGDEVLYYDFLIPEEQFEKDVKKPYPFMFYPEMNKITGAE